MCRIAAQAPRLSICSADRCRSCSPPCPHRSNTSGAASLGRWPRPPAPGWRVLPDIPTVAEAVRGYESSFWTGVGARKNTPVEIVDKLNREINAALADPKMKARLAELGATALPGSPADFS